MAEKQKEESRSVHLQAPRKSIKRTRLDQVTNLALRSITLASKFLLIFFLARFLTPAELGLYGLLAATISYSLYWLGFDFYTYSTRELLKLPKNQWGGMLKSQVAFTVVLYGVFCPMFLLLFVFGALPWFVACWFFVLLILEHLNQELMRLLVALSEPLTAGWVLFFRSGAWAVVATVLMYVVVGFRNLETVFLCWIAGGFFGVVIAAWRLRILGMGGWQKRVDWSWIHRGVRVALPLLVATLAIRGLFTIDRYWLEALTGLEVLGAYVLFMGIGNAMMSFLDAGVFAFMYPALIGAYQQGQREVFRANAQRLLIQTVIFTVVFVAIAMVCIDPLLGWLAKPVYRAQEGLFLWILLAISLYAIGMVPHYVLYAQGYDHPLIRSHIAGLFVFLGTTWLASLCWPHIAVPVGLCCAFACILLWKVHAYLRLTPASYRLFHF
ncbi:MAG: lipopolysaccharide biosynthesis protein [Desulfopila sp.]